MTREKLLEVHGLKTCFQIEGETAKAVDGLDFDIYKGEILGIVGESGSGKSVTALSLIQLIPNPPGEVVEGEILFKGKKIFDGAELKTIKELAPYSILKNVNGGLRHGLFLISFAAAMKVYSLLPLSGFLYGFLATVLSFGLLFALFYHSPQNKAYRAFRQRLFDSIREIRGAEIAMIFQEPMTSLNPVFSVGMQIVESLEQRKFRNMIKDFFIHSALRIKAQPLKNKVRIMGITALVVTFFSQLAAGWTIVPTVVVKSLLTGALLPVIWWLVILIVDSLISKKFHEESIDLFNRGVKLLDDVGIPDARQRMFDYPHQFSGGMRQRAMIAMALARKPSLLIADEPTTALDVTIQAQILELMLEVKTTRQDAAILLITHDLAVVAETCERVIVMYGGKIQEVATIKDLFDSPLHPYTQGLLTSIPRPTVQRQHRLSAIRGMVPNILNFPPGCKFCTRCDKKLDICDTVEPDLCEQGPGHSVRCHLYTHAADQARAAV